MNTILSRILSVALITATAAGPLSAQTAQKARAASASGPQANMTLKAHSRPEKSKGERGPHLLSLKNSVNSGFRTALSGKIRRAPSVKTAEGAVAPTMYGYVSYNDKTGAETASKGLYELPTKAGEEGTLISQQANATGGAVLLDGVYYCVAYANYWGMILVDVCAYDVETGQQLAAYGGDMNCVTTSGFAYDPTTGNVYGIGYNAAGNGLQLATYEFGQNSMTVNPICEMTEDYNSIVVDKSGQLYAITYTGHQEGQNFIVDGSSLKKIDKATGETTLVSDLDVLPQFLSSAAVDLKTDRCYWNVCPADGNGYIYEVDLATGATTPLFQLALNDQILGMAIPGPEAEDGAPAACQDVVVDFTDGSLTGKVSLTTPSTLFDGTAGSGELFVTVFANGEQVGYAEAGWGEAIEIDVDLSLTGAGKYDFIVAASNEVGKGPKTKVKNVWVGPDTPEATKATLTYANGNMQLSWLPVEGAINGGYLDTANLTYTVKDRNDEVVAEGLTVTSFTEAVAEPDDITVYYYTVYAVCGDLTSAPAKSNTVVLGGIVPPYAPDFATDGLAGFTNIDSDGDGKLWTVEYGNLMHPYNASAPIDDWLITPPLKLEGGKAYLVSFDYWNNSSAYTETLEVMWGDNNTVEAMTGTILPETQVTEGSDFKKHATYYLTPAESGSYFIGFHALSIANQYNLLVGNFSVEEGVSAAAPGAPDNLAMTPATGGELSAVISFTAPDRTMAGAELQNLTKVEVYRGETLVKTFDAPEVGAELSFVDNVDADGEYSYTVTGYNDEGTGIPAYVTGYIGINLPVGIVTATIARTDVTGEVTVTWNAVTSDITGAALTPDQVTYEIYDYSASTPVLLAEVSATSYTYQAVEVGDQDFVQLVVFPKTRTGVGEGVATDMIPVGTPYNGIKESFANQALSYIWGIREINGGSVSLINDIRFDGLTSQDDDNGFISIISINYDGGADFFTGLVSLEGMENPGMVFYTYNIVNGDEDTDINEITVSAREAGQTEWTQVMPATTVDNLCGGVEGWHRVSVSLDAFANKTVELQITGIIEHYAYIPIDNITVGSLLDHDLAVAKITSEGKARVGEEFVVDVKVVNEGEQAAGAFAVELYADGNLVEAKDIDGLAVGTSMTVSFERLMSPLATEPVSFYAKVVYAEDENADNNQTSSIEVVPVLSKLPAATDLAASSVEEGISLTWNEPELEPGEPEQITDDFEDADEFADEYGDWTFVDMDQSPVGGFQNMEIPGITQGMTTGSFWIWDASQLGNDTFAAHSGYKYLFALYRADSGMADDWAISPMLTGEAQTISFYARSYHSSYHEKITVYYSTGSKDPADFIAVEGSTDNAVPSEWTRYTVELPEGAKYFAIRSWATDAFMLMVDDVTYTPAPLTANLEIAGYNIYRDGVKINDTLVAECEYIDMNVIEDSQYTYVVTVVYNDRGVSQPSNEVVVTYVGAGVSGIGDSAVSIRAVDNTIVVLNAEGLDVVVASADGAVVYSGKGEARTEVAVGSGIYVVTAGRTVRKVIVK